MIFLIWDCFFEEDFPWDSKGVFALAASLFRM